MSRILFIALQVLVLLTTLFVAVDDHLFNSLSISLVIALPVRVTLWLNSIGFSGGGAVCPLTCGNSVLLSVLSLLAVCLSACQLWWLWTAPGRSVPQAFGPIERLLTAVGLFLVALASSFDLLLSAMGLVLLDMLVRAVTLGWMPNAAKLGHLLLAVAFWVVVVKQLRWLLASLRVSPSDR